MKKAFFSILLALVATVGAKAQQISVVSGGNTSIYSTLQAAIEAAPNNSVIYLPGGGFPIDDSVKVTKPLTIIGIGHKVKGENADGYTTISGNLWFNEGSSGSAVMGVYMTGNVKIGSDGAQVNNVLVRYCNINAIEVYNKTCLGTVINQNYIRSDSNFSQACGEFSNNIAFSVFDLDNGFVEYNIFFGGHNGGYYHGYDAHSVCSTESTSVKGNIFLSKSFCGGNCQLYENMTYWDWKEDEKNIYIENVDWSQVFVKHSGITPASDYHFKGDYLKYNGKCGIYAGDTSFSDTALPPVPYIVAKQIPEQTDANGKLNIKIRVRAGE